MSKRDKKYTSKSTSYILPALAILAIVVIVYLSKLAGGDSTTSAQATPSSVVSESNGTQYIDVYAKGGYTPGSITAKANMKTILRVKTSSTFDCSSALVIPSLNYRNNLPPTAVTEIEIPSQNSGAVIKGTCSMGMYRFNIKFN